MFGFGNFRTMAAAAALVMTAGVAQATTVSLTYNGGTAGGSATITAAPVTPVGGFGTYGAYGFNMTDSTLTLGDANGRFVAWCLDITHWLSGGPEPYQTTSTPFSNSYGMSLAEIARVQSVFDANYAGLNKADNTQAAGFQVALWNALYDGDWTAGGGLFAVAGGAVQTQADIFLLAASGFSGPQVYNLTFLESTGQTTRQNLVTATPVPLPAAAGLLLAALGGLGLMRRRRRMV